MTPSIIENLYRVFSKYKLHQKVTGCYCGVCLDEEFNSYVHNTQLTELSESYLEFYLMAVGILDEEGNDFKYFLPRILEVLLNSKNQSSHFYTIIWKTLGNATKYFNEEERLLLMQFAEAWYDKAKQSNDSETVECALLDLEEAGINIQ